MCLIDVDVDIQFFLFAYSQTLVSCVGAYTPYRTVFSNTKKEYDHEMQQSHTIYTDQQEHHDEETKNCNRNITYRRQ